MTSEVQRSLHITQLSLKIDSPRYEQGVNSRRDKQLCGCALAITINRRGSNGNPQVLASLWSATPSYGCPGTAPGKGCPQQCCHLAHFEDSVLLEFLTSVYDDWTNESVLIHAITCFHFGQVVCIHFQYRVHINEGFSVVVMQLLGQSQGLWPVCKNWISSANKQKMTSFNILYMKDFQLYKNNWKHPSIHPFSIPASFQFFGSQGSAAAHPSCQGARGGVHSG